MFQHDIDVSPHKSTIIYNNDINDRMELFFRNGDEIIIKIY